MRALLLLCCLLLPGVARADEPTLTITVGNDMRSFTRRELLLRPDATTIEVARDISYRVPMTYRAVPVASLLAGITLPDDSVIEAVALNGFVAQIPPGLLLNTDESKAVAWLAIEPQDRPWPPLPHKDENAGPFYIVWTGAEVGSIRSEQWPYQLAKLESQPSPAARWPALAVDPGCRQRIRSAPDRPCSSCSASPATSSMAPVRRMSAPTLTCREIQPNISRRRGCMI